MTIKNYIWAGISLVTILLISLVIELVKISYMPAFGQAAQPVVPVVGGLVVSSTNPLPINGSVTIPSPLATNSTIFLGGNPVATTNPFTIAPIVAGAAVSSTNPMPNFTLLGGTAVSAANPWPGYLFIGGSAVSTANPFTTSLIVGGAPVSVANPVPVVSNSNNLTYAAAKTAHANSATGDVLCISGSGTKVVKVKQLRVSATSGADVVIDIAIVLRSTLDTGGTPSTLTTTALDQNNAAGTAVVTVYAAAPTAGTLIGAVQAQKIATPKSAGNTTLPVTFIFGLDDEQPITLRGTTQSACVLTTALTTGSYDLAVEWTEE